jgi:hypothetical protein
MTERAARKKISTVDVTSHLANSSRLLTRLHHRVFVSSCGVIATPLKFSSNDILPSEFPGRMRKCANESGDLMNLGRSKPITTMREGFAANEVRTLIAKHLGIAIERVTDEAHFTNDFRADWLDRLELIIGHLEK